jgi:hypothetical protein
VRLNILRQMIDDEILQQRAAKLNLAASDEDVNAKLTEMKAPYTQEEFDKQLKARNITLDDLKRDLRRSLTKTKLLNKEIESKINITDAEISGYYSAHKAEFNLIEPQYHLAQIAVTRRARAADRQPAKQQGLRRRRREEEDPGAAQPKLEGGEDFGAYFRLPLESMVIPPGPLHSSSLRWPCGCPSPWCAILRACHVGLDGCGIAVVHIGLAAVDQVQIGHGIVVVGAVRHCLVEVLAGLHRPAGHSGP